jgi:RHS repeat-associated protein
VVSSRNCAILRHRKLRCQDVPALRRHTTCPLQGGEESGTTPTDFQFTGQRKEASFGLYDYHARYYDPLIGRFVSADSIVPGAGNPQALNRYSYVFNNPLKYVDPSGHEGCTPEDNACWVHRWYQAHGYEHDNGQWVYTGNYYFADPDIARELMSNVIAGHHTIRSGASFHFQVGRARISVEPRGRDNLASNTLSIIGFTTDLVDFSLTAGFTGAYTFGQLLSVEAGAPGVGATFVTGNLGYRILQGALFWVDVGGVLAAGASDVLAGRTGFDLTAGEIYLGVDTLASGFSTTVSNLPMGVVPGTYVSLAVDTAQVTYDILRLSGTLEGYSVVVRWR